MTHIKPLKIYVYIILINSYFSICRKFGKCENCEKPFNSSPPIVLPCGHRLCREDCFSIMNQMQGEKICPVFKCSIAIPQSFDENETPENQRYIFFLLINSFQSNHEL